jgi:putative PIN family toxin of toxin-antitoxin system
VIRAVIDVNVIVSAILGPLGLPRRVLLAWEAEAFSPITSAGIISKVAEKLSLPRISRRYNVNSADDIRWVFGLLQTQAELILVPHEECRVVTSDPEDDYVLATGRLARADYLVTGDHGLLGLGEYQGMKIVSPRVFLVALGQESVPY